MTEVVIVSAARSAVARGKADGSLAGVHPVDLSSAVMQAVYARLALALRSYRISGATTPTATVRAWNAQAGQDREQAVSSTYTTTSADTSQTFSNTLKVNAVPGWNLLELELSIAPGDSSVHFLTSFLLYNVVKRTH